MSFSHSITPSGDLGTGRVTEQPLIDLASVEYIASNACIAEAWKKVRANKGASGVDHITTVVFPEWARPQWKRIHRQRLDGTYPPQPALRVEIPKETGGVRQLGIPCVLDRVIMQSIAKMLGQHFHPIFSDHSYGYLPGRSVQQAARQAQAYYHQGYIWQITLDLENQRCIPVAPRAGVVA